MGFGVRGRGVVALVVGVGEVRVERRMERGRRGIWRM